MVVLAELQRKLKKPEYVDTGEPNLDAELASIHHKISHHRGLTINTSNDHSDPSLLLARGLPVKSFTEISGLPGTGKTVITLSLAVEVLQRGQKVLFVSADYGRFPLERARRFPQWRPRFEGRIEQAFLANIDQLMVLDLEWSQYALIIFSNFDHLVKRYWSRKEQENAYYGILERLASLHAYTCVVATCGCSRYQTLDGSVICAPKSALAGRSIPDAARILLYKSLSGNIVLHTGLAFAVTPFGLESLPPTCNDYAVPLALLSDKTRTSPTKPLSRAGTPSSFAESHNPLSETPKSLKRRRSLSSPVRTPVRTPMKASHSVDTALLPDVGSDMPIGVSHSATSHHDLLQNSELASTSTFSYVDNTTSTGSAITRLPASTDQLIGEANMNKVITQNFKQFGGSLAACGKLDLDRVPDLALPSVIPSSPERGEGVLDYSDISSHLSSDLAPLPAQVMRPCTAPSALAALRIPSFTVGEGDSNEFIPNSDEDIFLADTRPRTT